MTPPRIVVSKRAAEVFREATADAGPDDAIRLTPPRAMTLEKAIAYIEDDELVEVTPKAIRLRKRLLDPNARKRASRAAEAEAS